MPKRQKQVRIGIDIGRVIINGKQDDLQRELGERGRKQNYLHIPPVSESFRYIKRLVQRYGAENVWLISTCGERREERSRAWLEERGFYRETGVRRDQVIYCSTFPAKASIAQRLRLTHFVDDRPDVLIPMAKIVSVRILFNPEPEQVKRWGIPESAHQVRHWSEVSGIIAATALQRNRRRERPRTTLV